MTPKSSTTLRQTWIPEQAPGIVIRIDPDLESDASPSAMETGTFSVVGDHRSPPLALGNALEVNDYHVALISGSKWDNLQEPGVQMTSPASPAVLLVLSWKELVSRVSEVLRNSNRKPEGKVAHFSDIFVDFARMEVSRLSGEVIPMTNQEFKTLSCFLSNPGRVLSRSELLDQAWGYENYPTTRTVDTHVGKLRLKLERDPANPVHFRTVHRVGYKFVP